MAEDEITYLHCRTCLDELPENETPASYARLEIGITSAGNVLVWCVRHDLEVGTLTPEIIADVAVKQPCDVCGEDHDGDTKH